MSIFWPTKPEEAEGVERKLKAVADKIRAVADGETCGTCTHADLGAGMCREVMNWKEEYMRVGASSVACAEWRDEKGNSLSTRNVLK